MQVKFETDYLYLLFADSFFQDKQIGAKVTAAYRIVVNYLLSAHSISDLHQAKFLDLSPCDDDSGFYSAKQDYSIEFPHLDDEPQDELLARIECGDSRTA